MIRDTLPDWVEWLVFVPALDQGQMVGMKVFYHNSLLGPKALIQEHPRAIAIVNRTDFLNGVSTESYTAQQQKEVETPPPSKYHIKNPGGEWLDFYAVWDALMMRRRHLLGDSALGHSFKKLFAPGERDGGKDRLHDINDILWSVNRAKEQIEQENKHKRIREEV